MKYVWWFFWGALGPLSLASMGYWLVTDWGHLVGWDYVYLVFLVVAVIREGVNEIEGHVSQRAS